MLERQDVSFKVSVFRCQVFDLDRFENCHSNSLYWKKNL